LRFPKDPSQFFIKRIIGLPGETVCLHQGHVLVSSLAMTDDECKTSQGPFLNESYLPNQLETLGSTAPVHLGSNEFFVLGDNRTASSDSRVWGILPRDLIIGKVWLKAFPFSDFGVFHTPSY
jgi:signal peptidase I